MSLNVEEQLLQLDDAANMTIRLTAIKHNIIIYIHNNITTMQFLPFCQQTRLRPRSDHQLGGVNRQGAPATGLNFYCNATSSSEALRWAITHMLAHIPAA